MAATEKISVTLPRVDLVFLAEYQLRTGASRSGALHQAVKALREQALEDDYLQADAEWYDSGDARAWEPATGDGLDV